MIDLQTEDIRILERDELISAVIEKHERMIADYSSEYDTLKSTSGELDTEIIDLKKRIDENSEKTGVDEEKKNIYGNNACRELDKLDLPTMEYDKIKSGITSLMSSKNSDTVDERKTVYDSLLSDIEKISEKDTKPLLSEIESTFKAYQDENAARESVISDKALLEKKQGEVQENKRVDWLEKRIKSHQDSLEYWKGMK